MTNQYSSMYVMYDPHIDIRKLNIKNTDKILTWCHSGDQLFYYLLENPKYIVAIDTNVCNIYLTELKIASIKVLTHDEYLSIYGKNDYKLFIEKYTFIRRKMSINAQYYWDGHIRYCKSFHKMSQMGIILYYVKAFLHMTIHCKKIYTMICDNKFDKYYYQINKQSIISEFKRYYPKLNVLLSVFFNLSVTLDEADFESNLSLIFDNIDEFVNNNFVIQYLISGKYSDTNYPKFMKEDEYNVLKSRINNIYIHNCNIHDVIMMYSEPFTIYCPLNNWDIYSIIDIEKEFALVSNQMKKGRVIYHTIKYKDIYLFQYNESYISNQDTSYYDMNPFYKHVYFSFDVPYIYNNLSHKYNILRPIAPIVKNNLKYVCKKYCPSVDYFENAQYKDDILYYVSELFFNNKSINKLPLKEGDIYLNISNDAGNSIEHLPIEKLTKLSKIIFIDTNKDRCRIAKQRFERLGLNNYYVVCKDIFELEDIPMFDLISIHYYLSSQTQWKMFYEKCLKLLKPNGYFCVCDYSYNNLHKYNINRLLLQYFDMSPNKEHIKELNLCSELKKCMLEFNKIPFPFLEFLSMYFINMDMTHYIYIGRKNESELLKKQDVQKADEQLSMLKKENDVNDSNDGNDSNELESISHQSKESSINSDDYTQSIDSEIKNEQLFFKKSIDIEKEYKSSNVNVINEYTEKINNIKKMHDNFYL